MPAATSFRDPAGFCVALKGHILRVVAPDYVAHVEGFINSACGRKSLQTGALIPSRLLTNAQASEWLRSPEFRQSLNGRPVGAIFEHEPVRFPSFAHEWAPAMLYAAAELTLDLAADALACSHNLKDATPQNILFRGTKPVFVDLLSFEPRAAGSCVWKAYAQFVRTFLLPLLANRCWGTSLGEIFTSRRDGLESNELYGRCTWLQRLRPPFLTLISLPTWLLAKAKTYEEPRPIADENKARFILESMLKRLRGTLKRLQPPVSQASRWSDYMESHSYQPEAFAAKERFVQAALQEFKPAEVLDIGANTGHFSRLAAAAGAQVVAVDADANCVAHSFERARVEKLDVLSLVVDIARPTPAMGWRNLESASFLDRARGQFDAVLMLALVHHLLVTERVPLSEIVDLAAEITRSLVILEFVPRADPMFQQLLRGRAELFGSCTREAFEMEYRRRFEIVRAADLPDTERRLYLLQKKAAPCT